MIIRKIIHVDMDAFYASVEQRDNPELKGKPVAVGGSRERGVVAAASYEARKFGVHSAMPSIIAARKCPELIFVKPRFERYRAVSQVIRRIFFSYTPLVEPLSLDEAYLDVTHNLRGMPSATSIATAIRQEILEKTLLTSSAGISINKFLAKVASDYRKPNGQTLISPAKALEFMAQLPVEKFPYVGKKTAEKMHALNLKTGADILNFPLDSLVKHFGKNGHYFYQVVRCEQDSPVVPNRKRKSFGIEETYDYDLETEDQWLAKLTALSYDLETRLKKHSLSGKTLTLKIKLNDFELMTRSRTSDLPIENAQDILQIGSMLLQENPPPRPVRLMGLTLSNLTDPARDQAIQLTLRF